MNEAKRGNDLDRLKSVRIAPQSNKPVWSGPEGLDPQGGVTQSMIGRWLNCKERARVLFVEGLKPKDKFDHKSEFGTMFHLCDEWWNRSGTATTGNTRGQPDWQLRLGDYAQSLAEKYPFDTEGVSKWYEVCRVLFPIYADYWKSRPDSVPRTPLLQEQVFDVPHRLPSGRVVRLRGKWDGVSLVGRGSDAAIVLDESKTKGDVDESRITRQLTFDLQTMFYLVALNEVNRGGFAQLDRKYPLRGIRYNVVRRPLSGGKGNIVQHKPTKSNPSGESKSDYYARLAQYIKDEPHTYFFRWDVAITAGDIEKFRREFLDPCLDAMCNWWDHITGSSGRESPFDCRAPGEDHMVHWRHPFGVHNSLDEGGSSDLDAYLENGTTVGLQKVKTLFRELET